MIEYKMYQLNANLLSLLPIHDLKYVKPLKASNHESCKLWAMFYNTILSSMFVHSKKFILRANYQLTSIVVFLYMNEKCTFHIL